MYYMLDNIQRQLPKPVVTVVVPLFNKRDTVVRAIRSVKSQTLNNLRCVIVNNNSQDDPDSVVLAEIADDARFVYVNCEAQGVAHARNYGVKLADDCDYICCLDGDDEIAPEFLEKCVAALDHDNSLGMAYTGITAVAEDGERFVSDWPPPFDYESFIVGHNQVPTCCVFRRIFWERAGGYRQRYAPEGAGAEDAEFFLRVGALGGRGQKVSSEGLFVYYLGGAVSGSKTYSEPNWRAGKPWIEDGRHPFASVAAPANGESHLVRQYDTPLVSIVIPCGPGHAPLLVDCLDSIEAQRCRQWEVIVVADVDREEWQQIKEIMVAYPFVRLHLNPQPAMGAGFSRNAGAELARAPLLLFVDADDWLAPDALNTLLAAYADNPMTIIYGDYIGHAYIEDPGELSRLRQHHRLLDYNAKTTEATVLYHSDEYDCERAMRQPDARRPYIWNIVSSLLPRIFHEEIGGFDETMESWEDWDYWLRLARTDHCFTRVATPIMEYRFYSGRRRALANPTESGEDGRQLSSKLLEYMQNKYQEDGSMGCKSCGGSKRRATPAAVAPAMAMTMNEGETYRMASDDFVWVELIDGNIGSHRIVFQREFYGYRSSGERFKMKLAHAKQDNRVRIVEETVAPVAAVAGSAPPAAPKAISIPPAAPRHLPPIGAPAPDEADDLLTLSDGGIPILGIPVREPALDIAANQEDDEGGEAKAVEKETLIQPRPIFDFTTVWGIGPERQDALIQRGVRSLGGLIALDVVGIKKALEVPEKTAKLILQSAQELAAK